MRSFGNNYRFRFNRFPPLHSVGSPKKANLYRTHACFADTFFKPMEMPKGNDRHWGKILDVNIALNHKGRYWKRKILDPSDINIAKALRIVEKGCKWSYVILSRQDDSYYIQTDVFALEYRDGSESEHYYCPAEYLSSELVLCAFLSYAQESSWWKEHLIWKRGFGI